MKRIMLTVATVAFASSAQAEGDADAGRKAFGKCKSCHQVVSPEGEVLIKGGRTGPNLYGVIGREAAATDFKYSKTFKALAETGVIWDETSLAEFVKDPRGYLKAQGTDGKTRMTFKLKKGGEDVAAFLASLSPAPEVTAEVEGDAAAAEEAAETN